MFLYKNIKFLHFRLASICCLLLVASKAFAAPFPIEVKNPINLARSNELVSLSVPLAENTLDINHLANCFVLQNGTPIHTQQVVLARYLDSNRQISPWARAVLLLFKANLAANEVSSAYSVNCENSNTQSNPSAPSSSLQILEDSSSTFRISTGGALSTEYIIDKNNPSKIFDQVKVNGFSLLNSTTSDGLKIEGLSGAYQPSGTATFKILRSGSLQTMLRLQQNMNRVGTAEKQIEFEIELSFEAGRPDVIIDTYITNRNDFGGSEIGNGGPANPAYLKSVKLEFPVNLSTSNQQAFFGSSVSSILVGQNRGIALRMLKPEYDQNFDNQHFLNLAASLPPNDSSPNNLLDNFISIEKSNGNLVSQTTQRFNSAVGLSSATNNLSIAVAEAYPWQKSPLDYYLENNKITVGLVPDATTISGTAVYWPYYISTSFDPSPTSQTSMESVFDANSYDLSRSYYDQRGHIVLMGLAQIYKSVRFMPNTAASYTAHNNTVLGWQNEILAYPANPDDYRVRAGGFAYGFPFVTEVDAASNLSSDLLYANQKVFEKLETISNTSSLYNNPNSSGGSYSTGALRTAIELTNRGSENGGDYGTFSGPGGVYFGGRYSGDPFGFELGGNSGMLSFSALAAHDPQAYQYFKAYILNAITYGTFWGGNRVDGFQRGEKGVFGQINAIGISHMETKDQAHFALLTGNPRAYKAVLARADTLAARQLAYPLLDNGDLRGTGRQIGALMYAIILGSSDSTPQGATKIQNYINAILARLYGTKAAGELAHQQHGCAQGITPNQLNSQAPTLLDSNDNPIFDNLGNPVKDPCYVAPWIHNIYNRNAAEAIRELKLGDQSLINWLLDSVKATLASQVLHSDGNRLLVCYRSGYAPGINFYDPANPSQLLFSFPAATVPVGISPLMQRCYTNENQPSDLNQADNIGAALSTAYLTNDPNIWAYVKWMTKQLSYWMFTSLSQPVDINHLCQFCSSNTFTHSGTFPGLAFKFGEHSRRRLHESVSYLTYMQTNTPMLTALPTFVPPTFVPTSGSSGNSTPSPTATPSTTPGPNGVPADPSGLSATASAPGQVSLNWLDNSSTETGYKIFRKLTGSNLSYTEIGVIPPNSTSYLVNGLSPGTTYDFRVLAFNNNGNSESSNKATVTVLSTSTPTPSPTPTGTSTPTPTASPSASVSASPTITPVAAPFETPSATTTPSPTATMTPVYRMSIASINLNISSDSLKDSSNFTTGKIFATNMVKRIDLLASGKFKIVKSSVALNNRIKIPLRILSNKQLVKTKKFIISNYAWVALINKNSSDYPRNKKGLYLVANQNDTTIAKKIRVKNLNFVIKNSPSTFVEIQ